MGLILDSSVIIDAERRGETVERLIERIVSATGDQEAALSAVGLTEIVHGIYRASTYDANGNTTSKMDSTGTTDYSWDYENRLTSVTLPASAGTVTFKYDPFGRRIEKVSPATTSIFVYDGGNLVETANSSGTEIASYTLTQNIDESLAMLRGATTSYDQQDGLGSVTSLSNTAGALAQTYTYDSFGKYDQLQRVAD